MTEENTEYTSAMHELVSTTNEDSLGRTIAGVLEFLTARAILDGPYYITTDDGEAIAVFAANEATKTLLELLPENYKTWEDDMDEPEFLTNADPGDEQDEPTA